MKGIDIFKIKRVTFKDGRPPFQNIKGVIFADKLVLIIDDNWGIFIDRWGMIDTLILGD